MEPVEKEGGESPTAKSDSTSTTEVVSDFSDSEEWITPYAQDLVDIRSPTYQPALALRLSDSDSSKGIPFLDTPTSAPKYLNLATYAKAVKSPSKPPDLSFQIKPLVLGKKHKVVPCIPFPPPSQPQPQPLSVSTPTSTSTSTSKSDGPAPAPPPQSSISTSTSTSTSSKSTPDFPIPGRRFLPHQLPTYAPRVEPPDTVKVMATVEGPLGALRVAMQTKKRVKVWTRRDVGIRGYLTGFIEAFDKHWNLALRDVDEVFWRKRKSKSVVESGDQTSGMPNTFQKPANPLPQPSTPPPASVTDRRTRSKSKDKVTPTPRTPTKKSKRIAARSRSQTRRETLEADCSEDLVNWCRHKMQNMTLKDTPKKSKTKSPSSSSIASVHPTKSKSYEKKHTLTHFSQPWRDANGFVVVGVTGRVEIVERHVGQLFVMGNDVVMVETMR